MIWECHRLAAPSLWGLRHTSHMKNIWTAYWICAAIVFLLAISSAYKFGYNSGYMDGYNHKQRETSYFRMSTTSEPMPILEVKRVKKY